MHLNWNFFERLFFLKTVEAKVIILASYVESNVTMAINKFQKSRLTFDLSAKISHIGVPSIYLNSFLRNQSNSNFIVERSKFMTNINGHMTIMAAMPI